MTNPNIPPEIADSPAKWKSDDRVCTRWDLCPLAGQLHSHSPTPAPAPVRISPEVRETILRALCRDKGDDLERALHHYGRHAVNDYIDRLKASRAKIESAIEFVEALP